MFEGRTAIITGAAGDIGRAVAVRLARGGARLVLADLESAKAAMSETVEQCRDADAEVVTNVCYFDVTDGERVAAVVQQLAATQWLPEWVFNNAGYQGQFANSADYDLEDFRRVMDINVVGVFTVMRSCARALIAAGKPGSIVNTASMAGVGGAPNMAAYSASKSAVIGLTKSAAKDLASNSIRVNAISPAFIGPGMMWDRQVELQAATPSQYYADDNDKVATQMIDQVPMRRYGSLDEVAAAVQFLLSDESSYITGFNLNISGGAG